MKKFKDYNGLFRGSDTGRSTILFIIVLLILSAFYQYHRTVFYPPQSVHAWRQADCASISLNYYKYGMNFFHPQIHLLVSDNGTSGYCATSEIPIYYYAIALLYKLFGVNEFLIRLINLLIFFGGLYYLFRLLYKVLKDYFWSFVLSILMFTSPLLVYYANNYLTNISALSLGIIGFYHFYSWSENKRTSSLYYSAVFYLLAGTFKITGLFMVFTIIFYFIVERIRFIPWNRSRPKTFDKGLIHLLPFLVVVLVIISWVIYSRTYNSVHNSTHFSTTVFPVWNYDLEGIRGILEGVRKLWLTSYFNKYTIILIALLGLSIVFNYKYINPFLLVITVLLLPIIILFIMLQFWTFREHDYYTINMYILVVMILTSSFNGLLNRFPAVFSNSFTKAVFALFLLMNIVYARQEYKKRYSGWMNENSEFLAFREIREKLPEFGIHPDDTVICLPGGSQLALYLLDMNGWTAYVDARFGRDKPIYYNHDSTGIRESISRGARYLFVMGIEEIYRKPYLMDFTGSFAGKYKNILVFDLLSETNNFDIPGRELKLYLSCDMENLSAGNKYFLTSNDSVLLDFGKSQTEEMAFGGRYSSKLSADNAFSLTTKFEKVTAGESFTISSWVYDPKDHCGIIASGDDPDEFYYSRRVIEVEDSLGWRKIEIDFFVPQEIHGKSLNIYMYYPGTDSVYVDDFEIQYFEKPEMDWLLNSGSSS